MKTDDYKQELRLSATLDARNTKKIFLRSKKSANHLRSFGNFFRVAAEDRKIVGAPNCAEKNGPPLEGPLASDDDITLVSVF